LENAKEENFEESGERKEVLYMKERMLLLMGIRGISFLTD
jgi:hypothetical protein